MSAGVILPKCGIKIVTERQTYLLGTPVDTLLRVLRNNALLEAKHFACFVVNMSTLSCYKRSYKISEPF